MEKSFESFAEKSYRFKIVIGDWSDDGHGKSDYFVYSSNYPVEEIRQAYKDSCKLTGVQFNHNQDYTGRIVNYRRNEFRKICTEYEDYIIKEPAVEVLEEHGLDLSMFEDDDHNGKYVGEPEQFAELILRFIGLSLDDFQWEESAYKRSDLKNSDLIPPLNGYWNKDLNVQFGYGLYE